MTTFLLDENIDSLTLFRSCARQELCIVHRYPRRLMRREDSVLLADIAGGFRVLLTADSRFLQDNVDHIPRLHCGIVILRSYSSKRTMTTKLAESILENFKRVLPDWHQVPWSNSVIEISEAGVVLYSIGPDRSLLERCFGFDQDDWPASFCEALHKNAHVFLNGAG